MTRSPQRLIEMNHTRSSLRAAARVRKKEGASVTVCLAADAMFYMRGGGHLWVYLNWALSLRALGCRVIWLETVDPANPIAETRDKIALFKQRLARYGLGDSLAIASRTTAALPAELTEDCLEFAAATEADLLLNMRYKTRPEIVAAFRRTALVDIDPGLLQTWISEGELYVAKHDMYFTIGETVGQLGARFPDVGVAWQYTPPCVALDWWPVCPAGADAPLTTVTHWHADEWVGDNRDGYKNDKRTGFLPFLELPRQVRQPMELAACLGGEEREQAVLESNGWRVIESDTVTATPWSYQRYLQNSFGEFSCVKPSCVRFQNAWVSDRTICYLASGKPAIIQHTGPSRILPDGAGMFRFRDLPEAVRSVEQVVADYPWQCQLARTLAEENFDGRKVVRGVLERALS